MIHIKLLWQNKGIVTLSYLLSLIASFTVVVKFYNLLKLNFNTSLAPLELLDNFDFMIFSDLLRSLSNQLIEILPLVFILFWGTLLLNTFFSGGFIDAVQNDKLKFQRFFIYCFRFWGKNLIYGILLALLLFLSLMISGILAYLATIVIEQPDHRQNVLRFVPAVIFFILTSSYLFLLWDYGRNVLLSRHPLSVIKVFKAVNKVIFQNTSALKIFILFIGVTLTLIMLYLFLIDRIGTSTSVTLLLTIIIQQVFVYFRKFLRLLHLKMAGNTK